MAENRDVAENRKMAENGDVTENSKMAENSKMLENGDVTENRNMVDNRGVADNRKMAENDKKWRAAYFTVEASLILPIVMLFTVMMIFLAFYSYDRCILEHSAYEAALRGTGNHIQTASEAQAQAETAAGRLVEGKLFAMHDFHYDVAVDADNVTVTYHCVVNMPFLTWLGEYVSGIDMTLDISRSARRHRPTRIIRDCRILNRLIPE